LDKSGGIVAGKFAYEALQEGGQKIITFSASDASIKSVDFVYKRYIGKLATSGGKQIIGGPDAINSTSYNYSSYLIPSAQISGEKMTFYHETGARLIYLAGRIGICLF